MGAAEAIVVADDDPIVAQLLATDLTARGFTVTVALDGMQAMMAVRRARPIALILDALMPGGTGLEVLKRLRAMSRDVPLRILAVSATTDPALPQQLQDAGADAYLQKPLDLAEVYRTLCRLLGRDTVPAGRVAAAAAEPSQSTPWQQFGDVVLKRVTVLEQAAAAWQNNTLTAELQQRAGIDAHRLAGSLGMLDLPEGARLAREVEKLLRDRILLRQAHPSHLAFLVASLRKALPGGTA